MDQAKMFKFVAKLGELFETNPKAAQALVDLVDAIGGMSGVLSQVRENLTPSSSPQSVSSGEVMQVQEGVGRHLTPQEAAKESKERRIREIKQSKKFMDAIGQDGSN